MEQKEMTTPGGIGPDIKFRLTSEKILARAQGPPSDNLHQIFVKTDGGGIHLVYLDTTTQHLVYDPPVRTSAIIGPAQNYSTIFLLIPKPGSGGIVIRNYVTSTVAPRLTPLGIGSQPGAYRIKMEVPYPGATPPQLPEYQTFTIQDVDKKKKIVAIKASDQDIYWCPINEDSRIAGERLVSVKSTIGEFLIVPVRERFNIHPPLSLVSLGKSVVPGDEEDDS